MKRSYSLFVASCLSLWLGSSIVGSSDASAQLRLNPDQTLLPQSPIAECDFCIASQGISPLEMGHTSIRYDVRYLVLSKQYSDGKLVPNDENARETHFTQQATFMFHAIPEFSASVIVPFASRHEEGPMEMAGMDGMTENFNNTGLGDISLLGRFHLVEDHKVADTRIIAATLGVKLPTGSTNAKNEMGETADAHMQLGTGSTDLLAGANFLLAFDRFAIGANLLGVLSGKGANGHQFGNNLNYDLNTRYRIYPEEIDNPSFFATLALTGEWRGMEKQDGELVDGSDGGESSGGNVTYLAPGLQVFFSPQVSFEVSYHIPILHDLNGDQLGETYRIMSGIQYMF